MKQETLSIKELAEIVGVSTQAIYQRLDKDLQPYLQVIDGKKRLKSIVLYEVFDNKLDNSNKDNSENLNKELVNYYQEKLKEKESHLKIMVEISQQKDVELKAKNVQLQEKDDQIKQLLQALHNSQTLLKQNQDILKLTTGAEAVTTDPPETSDTEDIESETVPEKPKSQEKSRGFFSWFKK